jgi:hypothetical protein
MNNSDTELLTPVLDGGIHSTNFFNGRLLTAEDMLREQTANRLQHRQLGQAGGDGVAYGLEVSEKKEVAPPGNPSRIVSVTAGMAINRLGQALCLASDTDVALVRAKEVAAQDAGLFRSCEPPAGTDILAGAGIYLLVMAPASGFEGTAPASGIGGGGGGCRKRDAVEGVQFRLVEVKLEKLPSIGAAARDRVTQLAVDIEAAPQEKKKNLSKLRNLLAHLCFGTEELAGFVRDPFRREAGKAPLSSYGVVDAMRSLKSPALTDCDVPLALLYWTGSGIQFVDIWSVRRKPVPRSTSLAWPVLSARRLAEAEAVFLQFQSQIEEMTAAGTSPLDLARFEAAGWFSYLPAAGMIPIDTAYAVAYLREAGAKSFKAAAQSSGIAPANFFKGVTCRKAAVLEGAQMGQLLGDSFRYPPMDLDALGSEMIWLYFVRENIEMLVQSDPPRPYLVFTNGHMPYLGNARFDLARFNYSNYGFV